MQVSSKVQLIILVTVWLGFVGFAMPFPVITPLLMDDQGMLSMVAAEDRPLVVGLVLSVFGIGQMIGSPWLGKWSDTMGRRPSMILSLAGGALGYAITAWAVVEVNLTVLLLGRFVTGLCAGNIAISNAIAADISDDNTKAKAFTLIAIAINLGWIFGPLIGGYLADPSVYAGFGYDTPFWAGGLITLLALVMVAKLLPETRKLSDDAEQTHSDLSTLQLLGMPALRLPFLFSFFAMTAMFLYFEYIAFHYLEKFGLGPSMLANYVALISVPMIIFGLLVPGLERRMSMRMLNGLGVMVLMAGLLLYVPPEQHLWTIPPLMVVTFGIAVLWVSTSLMVSNSVDETIQGQALGLFRSISVMGEIVAALLGGVLASYGPDFPYIGGAGVCLLALMVLALYREGKSSKRCRSLASN